MNPIVALGISNCHRLEMPFVFIWNFQLASYGKMLWPGWEMGCGGEQYGNPIRFKTAISLECRENPLWIT